MIDFFSGRFFYQGLQERFNSERYQDFLRQALNQTSQHLIIVQDGAKYHTSKATRAFFEAHQNRLTVFQLLSYSPDYNPIEFLWKNMKQRATHNQYFPVLFGQLAPLLLLLEAGLFCLFLGLLLGFFSLALGLLPRFLARFTDQLVDVLLLLGGELYFFTGFLGLITPGAVVRWRGVLFLLLFLLVVDLVCVFLRHFNLPFDLPLRRA